MHVRMNAALLTAAVPGGERKRALVHKRSHAHTRTLWCFTNCGQVQGSGCA